MRRPWRAWPSSPAAACARGRSPSCACTVGLRRRAATTPAARRARPDLPTKVIEVTFDGDSVTPNGDRVEVDRRPADRARRHRRRRRRDPRALRPRSRSSSTTPAPPRSTLTDRPARASSTSSRTTLEKTIVQLEVPLSVYRPSGISSPTASAGPRTCRSRPSWRSPARWPRSTVSFTVLALAWRTPRYDAATSGRPAPAWLAALVDSAGVPAWRCAWSACSLLGYAAMAAVLRQGPADQPALRHLLRLVVGRAGPGLAAASARSGRRSARSARINAAFARLSGGDPDAGRLRLPRAARVLAGRGRALRVRVDGAGLPLRRPSSARCGCGARRTSR